MNITDMYLKEIAPEPRLIAGLRNDKLGFYAAIAEIVDNSLDAGATEVTIDIDAERRTITIRDNGDGCPDVALMIRLGAHERPQMGRTTSGRYGQGLSVAAMWLANIIEIVSIYRHQRSEGHVDWKVIEEENKWMMNLKKPEPTEDSSGTMIRLSDVFRPLENAKLKALREYLSQQFTPGINQGARILVNGVPVPQIEFPILQPGSIVQVKDSIGGKLFNLRAGKMQEANTKLAGLWFRHGHRFISRNNYEACGDTLSYHFHGIVELMDGTEEWQLERNKDGFHEADELYPILFPPLSALLELLDEEGTRFEIRGICEAIQHLFEGGFPGVVKGFVRRKRTGDKPGTKQPTGKGGAHGTRGGDPDDKGPADVFTTRSGMALQVNFDELETFEDMYAIERGRNICKVTYNLSNQTVQQVRNDSRVLYLLAVAGFVNELTDDENAKLGFDGMNPKQRYIRALSLALRGLSTEGPITIEEKAKPRRARSPKRAAAKVETTQGD